VVVPLEGADEGVQVTGMGGDEVDGDVGCQCGGITCSDGRLRGDLGWIRGKACSKSSLCCGRSLGERQHQTTAAVVFIAHTEERLPWVIERGREQAGEDGVQG
jgi:hypothetical protein